MPNQKTTYIRRLITLPELAAYVRMTRELMTWSQEQLAEISGLNVRTIQRVEQGISASFDTRRAIARAFGSSDIDVFNKPLDIPTEEGIKKIKDELERDYITLKARPLDTGKEFASLVVSCMMDLSQLGFEASHDVEVVFAEMIDYFREYRDYADMCSEAQKLEVHIQLDAYINALAKFGVTLRHAVRQMQTKGDEAQGIKPLSVAALYLIGFETGHAPEEFVTPKKMGLGL